MQSHVLIIIKKPDTLAHIAHGLMYGAECYENLPIGTPIALEYFHVSTSYQRRNLASALGVDINDFATHSIDPEKVNPEHLVTIEPDHFDDFSHIMGNYQDQIIAMMFMPYM
ncbi:hypothetical protein [Ralstonia phage RP13]|nr:hypothetical protein [Ralstonia phage RP13]